MRILGISKVVFVFIFTAFYCVVIQAQTSKNNTNTEDKVAHLIAEKRKINPSLVSKERYKIQIFSGESEKAKKTVIQFKQEFKDIDATIVFNTPNYKVWVGNFKSRMEAERNFAEIKKKYKNTLLIKPQK
ncbi:MAG: hypothetical protein RL423_1455 [Bacteroidota bacterium]|jgi:hypothetical protein